MLRISSDLVTTKVLLDWGITDRHRIFFQTPDTIDQTTHTTSHRNHRERSRSKQGPRDDAAKGIHYYTRNRQADDETGYSLNYLINELRFDTDSEISYDSS